MFGAEDDAELSADGPREADILKQRSAVSLDRTPPFPFSAPCCMQHVVCAKVVTRRPRAGARAHAHQMPPPHPLYISRSPPRSPDDRPYDPTPDPTPGSINACPGSRRRATGAFIYQSWGGIVEGIVGGDRGGHRKCNRP